MRRALVVLCWMASTASADDLASVRVGVVVEAPGLPRALVNRLENAARAGFGRTRGVSVISGDTVRDAVEAIQHLSLIHI